MRAFMNARLTINIPSTEEVSKPISRLHSISLLSAAADIAAWDLVIKLIH